MMWMVLVACGTADGYGSILGEMGGETVGRVQSAYWYQGGDEAVHIVEATWTDACTADVAAAEVLLDPSSDVAARNAAEAARPAESWWAHILVYPSDAVEGFHDLDDAAEAEVCHQTDTVVYADDGSSNAAEVIVCDQLRGGSVRIDRFDDPENTFTDGDLNADLVEDGGFLQLSFHAPVCAPFQP